LRARIALALTGALSVTAMVVGSTAAAQAATASRPAAVKNVCSHQVPARYLQPGTASHARPSAAELAAIAQAKAQLDKGRGATQAAEIRRLAAAAKTHEARKLALLRAARHSATSAQCAGLRLAYRSLTVNPPPGPTSGPGYSYIDWMYHYTQVTNYFCGPASVEVMSATVPGPSPIGADQYQLASDMGTTSDNGTDFGRMVNELNSVVGGPDLHNYNYYLGVWMDYNPTDAQRAAFVSNLKFDVRRSSPIVGNALEVHNGPHLVGNPNLQADIGHYIVIGGWDDNTGQVWYTDSAQNVWYGYQPPDYSWISTYDMETILGGRGYIW
jgi:Peptidase_C39 like family